MENTCTNLGNPATSPRFLTIRELVRQAGVSTPTVHHYVAMGLLPAPRRPHRRMAYYDPACVGRIALIKSLQTKRFIPLGVIKQLLDSGGAERLREADAGVVAGLDTADPGEPRAEVLRRHPLDERVLAALERDGLINPGSAPFTADEAAIVAAVHSMREAGLDERLGFTPEQLGAYRATLGNLIDSEFALFNSNVLGKVPPDQEVRLAAVAIEGVSRILTALHRRMVRERLGEILADKTPPPRSGRRTR
jgi:DNA-binding transcriptional MerR regulator